MSDPENQYNLKDKANAELHKWIAGHKPDTVEYIAGIQELMRRNAAPVRKRELVAMGIAILSLAVAMIVIMLTY